VSRAGAVIHNRGPQPRDGVDHRRSIEKVYRFPLRGRTVRRGRPSRPMPADDIRAGISAGVGEEIEQVTAGKAGGARDEGGACHQVARYRGTPPSAPLNGEKLPSPASVNDMKNRWSAAIGETPPLPKW